MPPIAFVAVAAVAFAPLASGCATQGTNKDGSGKTDAPTLHWYRTCGDPVCRDTDAGVANACSGQQQNNGVVCYTLNATCNLSCGAKLVCTVDPFDLTRCPESSRSAKRDVTYLDPAARRELLTALRQLKLARYRYTDDPAAAPARLGFIIDDRPPASLVQPNGRQVDLYGFISLVAAAVQAQDERIAALQQEVARLRAAAE